METLKGAAIRLWGLQIDAKTRFSCCVGVIICIHNKGDDEQLQPPTPRNYSRHVGKRVDVEYLVGAHEIAKRLGLKNPHTIHVWRTRHKDFPKPVAKLKTAMIGDWAEISAWISSTGRRA